jgi:hypothetical protein
LDQRSKLTYYDLFPCQTHAKRKQRVEEPLESFSSFGSWIPSVHNQKHPSQQDCEKQFGKPTSQMSWQVDMINCNASTSNQCS